MDLFRNSISDYVPFDLFLSRRKNFGISRKSFRTDLKLSQSLKNDEASPKASPHFVLSKSLRRFEGGWDISGMF